MGLRRHNEILQVFEDFWNRLQHDSPYVQQQNSLIIKSIEFLFRINLIKKKRKTLR